jgi:hypothetical protein
MQSRGNRRACRFYAPRCPCDWLGGRLARTVINGSSPRSSTPPRGHHGRLPVNPCQATREPLKRHPGRIRKRTALPTAPYCPTIYPTYFAQNDTRRKDKPYNHLRTTRRGHILPHIIEDELLARWAGRYREEKGIAVGPLYQGFALRWMNRRPFGAPIHGHERGTETVYRSGPTAKRFNSIAQGKRSGIAAKRRPGLAVGEEL